MLRVLQTEMNWNVEKLVTTIAAVLITVPAFAAEINLLNVSYDPTRELYVQFNKAFAANGRASIRPTPSPSSSRMAARANRPAR